MLERPLSGGDGCPQHRRERRMERGDLPPGAVLHEALHVGHFAGVDERLDDLPVGGIPPDQQNFTRCHGADTRRTACLLSIVKNKHLDDKHKVLPMSCPGWCRAKKLIRLAASTAA